MQTQRVYTDMAQRNHGDGRGNDSEVKFYHPAFSLPSGISRFGRLWTALFKQDRK